MQLKETFERVKRASKSLALLSDEQRNEILNAVADAIIYNKERILEANAQDLAKMEKSNPLYDRLQLACHLPQRVLRHRGKHIAAEQ